MAHFAHFPQDTIHALYREALSHGLVNDSALRTLTTSINPYFLASTTSGDTPADRFLLLLDHLNRTERLRDGTVPFEVFLAAAVIRAPEAQSFEAALAEVRSRATSSRAIAPEQAQDLTRRWAARVRAAGGPERIIGTDDTVSYAFLSAGHEAGKSVGKLIVPRYDDGVAGVMADGTPRCYAGTGWLLANDLVITNHHVVNARNEEEANASVKDLELQATNTHIVFDFDAMTVSGVLARMCSLEAFSEDLDYALLRLASATSRKPLRLGKVPPMTHDNPLPAMNIIQHPFGNPKRVALRNNLLFSVEEREIGYFSDTERGSSGSPVFDDAWRVVALHRRWRHVRDDEFQRTKELFINAGVPIHIILADLATRYPAVRSQIP